MSDIPTVHVTGSIRNPQLLLAFPPRARHATNPSMSLMEWVRSLPGARFDPATAGWESTGTGDADPHGRFTAAGFTITGLGEGEFAGVTSLNEMVWPVSMLSDDQRTVLVRPRLSGFETCRELIGPAALWDKTRKLFKMPLSDVLTLTGEPRDGVIWDPRAIEACAALRERTPLLPGLEQAAARLGVATDRTTVEDDVRLVAESTGHYPDWWSMPPMAHQIPGALAVAAGHTLLADAPGVGKTLSALLAAAVCHAERVLVVCPPVVATHWMREVVKTGLASASGVVVVRAGKKTPKITDAKVVVVADSMLVSRPALVAQTASWAPSWVVVDEAHRFKNAASGRADALLRLKSLTPDARHVAMTGTPLMSSPHELVPLLEFTGHLMPVFGGASAFLNRYCRQDKYGGWHPNKRTLRELNRKLNEQVWVRRTKEQVLPNLPEATSDPIELVVDLAEYRRTHADIIARVDEWIASVREDTGGNPADDDIDAYVDTALAFVSWLRRAAGLAKVPQVTEMVRNHLAETTTGGVCERPVIVWAHHSEVVQALQEALKAPAITGGTSANESTRLIDAYQAGTLPVLICSITAVGAGITLTRGSDAIFAELDWTPAMMQQAVDRQRRIGQKNAITVRWAIALGTLDEHMGRVVSEKARTVGAVLGDSDADWLVVDDRSEEPALTPSRLIRQIIEERLQQAA